MKATATQTRIQLKNILFATDFSHAATTALPFAGEIAQRFGAHLFAVHAKTPENYALPTAELWPMINAEAEKLAGQLKASMHSQFSGIDSDVLLGEGGVWSVIEAAAKEKNADLIVVGTQGRRGIGKFFLGSVAEEILRRAKCPVLTVGPHSRSEAPLQTTFRRIVFATDFGEGSRIAATYAVSLAQEHQAHLTLLHVIEHPKGELVHPQELENGALLSLRALAAGEAELWCQPKFVVRHGTPAEKILEAAEKDCADLIVLGLRDAKSIGPATHLTTVAHQIISQATCPVLTVRP